MSIFVTKGQREKEQAMLVQQENTRIQNENRRTAAALAYMKVSSYEVLVEAFEEIEEAAKRVLKGNNNQDNATFKEVVIGYITTLKTLFFKIDRKYLSEPQLKIVGIFFVETLPKSMFGFAEANTTWETRQRIVTELSDANYRFTNILKNQKQAILNKEFVSQENTNEFTFDNFKVEDKDITVQIKSISVIWSEIVKNNLTAEEEYFLEQVTSSYIPETLKLYRRLQIGNVTIQEQAKTVTLEQLKLIEARLTEILSVQLQQVLNVMKIQTSTIKSMTDESLSSSLSQ